jgi:acetoin utilization protein AcuB
MDQTMVGHYMIPRPATIGPEASLASAHRLMRERRVRHLPVLQGRRLVGVVSQDDLHLIETLKDVDPEKVTVDEAMTPEPYFVGPRTSLARVARAMAEHKWGCTVVLEKASVVGIFTATDALALLAQILEGRFGRPNGKTRRHPGRVSASAKKR